MAELNPLPGLRIAVVKPEFERVIATAATMFNTEMKTITHVASDKVRTQMYVLSASVYNVALAMGAIETDLPTIVLGEYHPNTGRRGSLLLESRVHPEFGFVDFGMPLDVHMTSIDVDEDNPYYQDIDGTKFKLQVAV